MRLFLLPISTRRTLIYCQRLNVTLSQQQTLLDKATTRAANLWASWEKKEKGWQKRIVELGNQALKRIPYEEWGLKSIPPLSARRKEEELAKYGKAQVEVSFPPSLIQENTVTDVLRKLGTERESLHRSRMIYCFIGMPITAPIALIPVVPNIPFFYLVYRAWSHWRALAGSRHIQFLLEKNLVIPKPSSVLDALYSPGIVKASRVTKDNKPALDATQGTENKSKAGSPEDAMVLDGSNAKPIAEALELPELEAELERAIWQVDNSLKSNEELQKEKNRLDKATSDGKPGASEQEKK